MDKFYCDMCTAEMEQTSISKAKKGIKLRRYRCPICDYRKTIFGSGFVDEELIPIETISDSNRIFKQEEINRYYDNNTNDGRCPGLQDIEEISPEWKDGCGEDSDNGTNQ